MALLYVLFAKTVPIISMWELKAGEHVPLKRPHQAATGHQLGDFRA
jgi:hypothetical protein